MKKHSVFWYIVLVVSALGILGLALIITPQVRMFMIDLAERFLIHHKLDSSRWMGQLIVYMRGCIACILAFDFFVLTTKGQRIGRHIANETVRIARELNPGKLLKPVLVMFGIYALGMSALIRANFLYDGDIGRTIEGYKGWHDWSRYISNFLSMFIHADYTLTDISPLPQLIAALFIAISSVLLVYILGSRKITMPPLLASISAGLSPFFLQCLSYKFDAPYMALSVLASILPFLFMESSVTFIAISVLSLLVMCMTYQASSGIYLLLIIAVSFKQWNAKERSNREIAFFTLRALGVYVITLIAFRILFMVPINSYVSTGMFSPAEMIPGVIANIIKYTKTLYADLSAIWKVLAAALCMAFVAWQSKTSRQNKGIAVIFSVIAIIISYILSYGAYLALRVPEFTPRSLYGFGIFIAIVSIFLVQRPSKYMLVPAIALSWSFFVFAFSYGNALADQKRYIDFRTEILLGDLSDLFPDRKRNEMRIQLEGTAGFAPSIGNISKRYPVIEKLVLTALRGGGGLGGTYYMVNYFNWGEKEMMNHPQNPSSKVVFVDFAEYDLPVILDSYYHTIKSDGENILVILKNGE
jgi:hypothetical protein